MWSTVLTFTWIRLYVPSEMPFLWCPKSNLLAWSSPLPPLVLCLLLLVPPIPRKKEHGKETFFFSLPPACAAACAGNRRCGRVETTGSVGRLGLTTTIDHLGCRLLTSHSPKVSRANVANRHHFSSIPNLPTLSLFSNTKICTYIHIGRLECLKELTYT